MILSGRYSKVTNSLAILIQGGVTPISLCLCLCLYLSLAEELQVQISESPALVLVRSSSVFSSSSFVVSHMKTNLQSEASKNYKEGNQRNIAARGIVNFSTVVPIP